MIWLNGFPIPPSVNDYLFAAGRGHLVKSESHRKYLDECHLWRLLNQRTFGAVCQRLYAAKRACEADGRAFALKVDVYVAFHVERVIARNGQAKVLDANNRLKPLLDGLAAVTQIDDRYFFAGNCEKVTTLSKDLECCLIRISMMRPRTLDEIKALMLQETNTPASS